MIWMWFIACLGNDKENIELCEQARVGFFEYQEELESSTAYQSCDTMEDCTGGSNCRTMCGASCVKIVSNEDSYSEVLELLRAYEEEHCQVCANYPYEEPISEPVSEPPFCIEGMCD